MYYSRRRIKACHRPSQESCYSSHFAGCCSFCTQFQRACLIALILSSLNLYPEAVFITQIWYITLMQIIELFYLELVLYGTEVKTHFFERSCTWPQRTLLMLVYAAAYFWYHPYDWVRNISRQCQSLLGLTLGIDKSSHAADSTWWPRPNLHVCKGSFFIIQFLFVTYNMEKFEKQISTVIRHRKTGKYQ